MALPTANTDELPEQFGRWIKSLIARAYYQQLFTVSYTATVSANTGINITNVSVPGIKKDDQLMFNITSAPTGIVISNLVTTKDDNINFTVNNLTTSTITNGAITLQILALRES